MESIYETQPIGLAYPLAFKAKEKTNWFFLEHDKTETELNIRVMSALSSNWHFKEHAKLDPKQNENESSNIFFSN